MRRAENPMIRLMQDWGGWRRTKKQGQGWGGSVDFENTVRLARDPGTHSDPVYSEFAASIADGQGIYQFLERQVSIYMRPHQIILIARYEKSATWQRIAEHLKIHATECEIIHDAMLRNMRKDVVDYINEVIFDHAAQNYERDFAA